MQASVRRTMQALLAILIVCGAPIAAMAADARSLFLEHLSTLDGLPQGTVYATFQDSQGFVWFATEDGLVRYDGHEIHRYAYSADAKEGLPGNFVFSIAEDAHTDLWLALKGSGVARWNRATDTFTVFRHDKANPRSLCSDLVRTLLVDSHNRIWIGTLDAGVDVLEPNTGRIAHLSHESAGGESLADNRVYALTEDTRGAVWIGTGSGIDRRNLEGERFTRSADDKPAVQMLSGKVITQLAFDRDATVWVGTFDSGLFHLDDSGRVIAHFRHIAGQSDSISSDEIHAVLQDHDGHLWIGTAEGLDYLSPESSRVGHYIHDKSDFSSLSDSFVMSLYEDNAGLLWIGTRAGGVNRWNSHSWELGGSRPRWLEGKAVASFADAPDSHLWVGTLGAGLFNVNLRTGEASNLDAVLHADNALGDRRVMSLLRDHRGNLWIGTLAAGLKKLSSDGRLVSIPVAVGDSRSLSAPGVAAIYETKNGSIWIGTHGGGANVLDPATGIIKQLPFSASRPGATSSENVTSFTEDLQGNVWIGTENGGVDLASPDGTVFKTFHHEVANPHSLSADIIYAITTDATGRVWVATDGGGLNLALGSSKHAEAVEFQTLSLSEGLSSDTVYAVVPDSNGHLWLSGNAGLMRFDPATHAIKTYHREHGLQSEEFNFGAYLLTRDGHVCFGGPYGFNIFDPSRLTPESKPPRIALTGLEILGAPVNGAVPYWVLQTVPLDYRAAVVAFDFAALDFTSPNRNRLAYRVSGLTDKWIDLKSQRRVTLTNLDAGDHILEVRAASADSVWSTEPYRLTIHKQAAPWRTKTAYAIYALLLAGVVLWALRAQRAKLTGALTAKQRLESEVALRTKELLQANQQLIVASEAKSDFLSRMSHELRTPMNGVVGMAELIARSPLSDTQARQIQTIRSSAHTLLQILNDLLDLSKAQAGKIELEALPLDLPQLIEECVALFAGAAESKGLNLVVCPLADAKYQLLGDSLRLRQILMNLIGNAVKFTERGEIVVTCDATIVGAERMLIKIAVADTGIGISGAAMRRIFEPFSQADETTTRRFGGTGLGLSICQQLVSLMGGDIAVDSQPRSGSTFTVSLPMTFCAQPDADGHAPMNGKTMLIMTRRRALAESLRRHAQLLGAASRVSEPIAGLVLQPNEVILLDADSYPFAVDEFAVGLTRRALIVVASVAAVESRGLESRLPDNRLLRSPIERAALYNALSAVDDPTAAALASKVPVTLSASRFSAHVLIVEDDIVNAAVAQGFLGELGCRSAWVKDGVSAIARNAVERFDLILMDLSMPGLDGYETTRQIREGEFRHQRVPIIALTAHNATAYRDFCKAAGMDDILTKPYTLAECAAILSRWIEQDRDRSTSAPLSFANPSLTAVDSATVAQLRSIGSSPDGSLYARLVTLFQKSSSDALAQIGAALNTHDFTAAGKLAHKLKGAAANVGALGFSTKLGELEQCCNSDRRRAGDLCTSLAMAHPALIAELANFTVRESA